MFSRLAAAGLAAFAITIATTAAAAKLPEIKVTARNTVPACATPGRLMSFIKSRNPRVHPRYDQLAVYYMRHGEDLGIRWDIAFFQMLVETATLGYTGDVDASQNNFAGLGATGGGVKGERFRDIDHGVRAHLEHVLMYTGETIQNPVAERTRKVQEWKVLASWQRSIRGPMTFSHLTTKWAPSDRGYSKDIKTVADQFYNGVCRDPDPEPELLAMARGETQTSARANRPQSGAPANTRAPIATLEPEATSNSAKVAIVNPGAASRQPPANPASPRAEKAPVAASEANPDKCRVWTASYGGAKAIIIKAVSNDVTNYTVLDVNAGKEKREAEAYIAAYAKGGETLEEFASASAALDKAFKLCPEG